MAEKDFSFKLAFSTPARFADLCNMVLYRGEQVISPSELSDANPETILKWQDERKSGNERRQDLLMKCPVRQGRDTTYVLYGLEGQSKVDYSMPVRMLEYDAREYARQLKRHSANGKRRAFHKRDTIMPVISIVVNLSGRPWKGPVAISEVMKLPENIVLPIQNYEMKLFDPYTASLETIEQFRSDLKFFFLCCHFSKSGDKLEEIVNKYQKEYSEMDEELFDLLQLTLDIHSGTNGGQTTGESNMCKAIREIRNAGRKEGKEEGRKEGKEEGRKEGKEEGRKEGRKEGKAEGRKEGIQQAITQFVAYDKERNTPLEQIIQSLEDIFHLSPEEAMAFCS